MEEYLLSQLDTPVVLKDGTMMTFERSRQSGSGVSQRAN